MITFTRLSDNKSTIYKQLDHRYKFLYKNQILWSIMDTFDSKPKHVYRYKVIDGNDIQMDVNSLLKEKLVEGYIYGYDDFKNQIVKIKSRKIEDSKFIDMSEWIEMFELEFSIGSKILFIDNFYDNVIRKDELTKSIYIFTNQLYKIIHYKDTTDIIQLTNFKSSVPNINVKKMMSGIIIEIFTIEQNCKLVGDSILPISTEDYNLIKNYNLELTIEIC